MAQQDYSKHQKDIISHYYKNLDTIQLSKLSELVSELFLADSEKKQMRLWERVAKAMQALKVPPTIMDHILKTRDVEVLAKNLQEWQAGKMGTH